MFDSRFFKKNAWRNMKANWKPALLVTLICFAVILPFQLPEIKNIVQSPMYGDDFLASQTSAPWYISIIVLAVSGILNFASARFFIVFASDKNASTTIHAFLDAFNEWIVAILSSLWIALWTFLWSCLFFIPGIVKSIAYSQTLYILAENPRISIRKALKMSIVMTRGYKGDLFALALSFIGWLLLSVLTAGILLLWIIPYMNTTLANAYFYLKEKAITNGTLSMADFDAEQEQF